MRKRPLLIVVFLLMLYIGPMVFTPYYLSLPISTEQNMSKDFLPSGEGDISPQSTSNFGETLSGDVLYYPDVFFDNAFNVADAGEDDWINSTTNTGITVGDAWVVYTASGTDSEEIYFTFPNNTDIESFNYSCYSYAPSGTGSLDYYNGTDWVVLDSFTTSYPPTWKNGTYSISSLGNQTHLELRQTCTGGSFPESRIFYLLIEWGYMLNPYPLQVADAGEDDWIDSTTNTGVAVGDAWIVNTASGNDSEEIYFTFPNSRDKETFTYSCYSYAYSGTGSLDYWNGTAWVVLDSFTTSYPPTWKNGTYSISSLGNQTHLELRQTCTGGSFPESRIFYLEVYFIYGDNQTFSESFADVSDWILAPAIQPTTDTDVITWEVPDDYSYDWIYTNNLSVSGSNYIEYRIKANVTPDIFYIKTFTLDDYQGVETLISSTISTSWATYRYYTNTAIESLAFIIRSNSKVAFYADYLRISPPDEMGWSHDASTTAGTDANFTDGDLITVTDSLTFDIDTTTTPALIETSYYPFLDLFVEDGSGYILVEVSDGSSWSTVVNTTLISSSTLYQGNALATGLDIKQIRVNASLWATVDYCRLYSIANFTVTQSGTSIDDILFVSDGGLYCSGTSFTSIILEHDPTLNVTQPFLDWNMNTTLGTPEVDFYNGSWVGYTNETTGGFPVDTTITDFRLKFTATANIIFLKFIDTTGWHIISSVNLYFDIFSWNTINSIVLIFSIELNVYSLSLFFLFLGLAMIPLSVVYLAKGGREEMNMDKVFYGLVVFIFGWALFLGGIFG